MSRYFEIPPPLPPAQAIFGKTPQGRSLLWYPHRKQGFSGWGGEFEYLKLNEGSIYESSGGLSLKHFFEIPFLSPPPVC